MIVRQCCVCGLELGRVEDGEPAERVSHTYCPRCLDALERRLDERPVRLVHLAEARVRGDR